MSGVQSCALPISEGTNGWSVDVNWGDGTAHTAFQLSAAGTIPAQSHTFDDGPSTPTVTVTVTDKDHGSDSKSFTVTVSNVNPTAALGNSRSEERRVGKECRATGGA